MGNKYLYQKMMSSKEDNVMLLPTSEDLDFLEKLGIKYHMDSNKHVTINTAEFFNKIAA